MKSDYSQDLPNRLSAAARIVEVLLVLTVFFVIGGTPVPGVNEPHYLGRFKHFWDPAWCQGDLFFESPDAHLTVVLLAGWLTHFLSLPAFAWLGRLAAWGVLAFAWQRLSWRVAPLRWCSVLTAALWVTGIEQLHLAGEWVVGGVEAKAFAYAFVLLALKAYLDDCWSRVWVLLGIASALHALVGGWSVLVLLCLWAAYHRRESPLRSMLPGLIAGGAISLLGVLPPILMNRGVDPEVVSQANEIYVFFRLPHHLALLSMRDDWLSNRALRHTWMLVLLACCGALLVLRRRRLAPPLREDPIQNDDAPLRLVRFAWGAATLMLIGFAIEAGLADHPAAAAKLLKYYWFRLTDVAAPLAAALWLGAALTTAVRGQKRWSAALLLVLLAAPVWHFSTALSARLGKPAPPADRRVADYGSWLEACRWVDENAPPGARFLVPLHSHTFKWRTGHAEVVSYKDVPQDAPHLVQWHATVNDIYYHTNEAGQRRSVRSLSHLGASRLQELGREYGADFALTVNYRPVSLPVAHHNAHYTIYDLRD
ncbi:hypothetical protein Pla123a_42800 [Posidoniimonas polymericola]|uniref:DUF6798 domain-containing protein n=1 Tax=Posidoniimonas polymericola TaxID=2528002 RepID=A0A5C5XXX8_9BACT|nr:DUF6798 domain-containing protein [Posidoniimonas polymericola]TWT67724.1 hypothetical protein Pla123a_42800 [Posidoniimonas polymericola]